MKIINTGIKDININNIDETKIEFADNIISKIKPLIDSAIHNIADEVTTYDRKLKFKDNEIVTKKNKLKKDSEQLKRQEKISQLLENISKMIDLGIMKNTSFKNEVLILLKIIPKLDISKIEKHLNKTTNIVKKHA